MVSFYVEIPDITIIKVNLFDQSNTRVSLIQSSKINQFFGKRELSPNSLYSLVIQGNKLLSLIAIYWILI